MRIVSRPDFDGIVCAAIICEAEKKNITIKWTEPTEIQGEKVKINNDDIITNLPYSKNCNLWFDHHCSNKINMPFKGIYKITPSAARNVFDYYKEKLSSDFNELIDATDKIDSADLTLDEIHHPENYPYILLSMTVTAYNADDEVYWNELVSLLRNNNISETLKNLEVKKRTKIVIKQNSKYKDYLLKYTELKKNVSITDFRSLTDMPSGNRFLIYSLFPESVVSVKVSYTDNNRDTVSINIGHSIVNKNCNVNAAMLLKRFGGGGHNGAAACKIPAQSVEKTLNKIIDVLKKNKEI